MDFSAISELSVYSLNCPFSCNVQETLRQQFGLEVDLGGILYIEALRLCRGDASSERASLSHISIFPTLMMEASLVDMLSEFRRRSPSLRSKLPVLWRGPETKGLGVLTSVFSIAFGLIGCQHSSAASQESKVSGTCGRRCTPTFGRVETSRNVERVSPSYSVRT